MDFNKQYDLIFGSFCIENFSNNDAVKLLQRMKPSLIRNIKPGVVIVKESNIDPDKEDIEFDEERQTLGRTHEGILDIFDEAGYNVEEFTEDQFLYG